MRKLGLLFACGLFSVPLLCFANTDVRFNQAEASYFLSRSYSQMNPVDERVAQEARIPNYFGIAFHKPTYVLPYYYTGSPDNADYRPFSPDNQSIRHGELKFQFSFKVPAWQHIFNRPSTLYLAFTQLSYFQIYSPHTYFRENDYEPEIFVANQFDYDLTRSWKLNFLNVGYEHQSNGVGTALQRSWDRIYLEGITTVDNWMIAIKPWIIVHKNSNNEDIGHYLGYAREVVSYKIHDHVVSLEVYNVLESAGKRGAVQLTYSFPLTKYIKGYLQFFSGYGQSLVEYKHRTNSGGIGVSFNDWV